MANIDHVNRRFFLRVLLFPFVSLIFCFKYLGCSIESRRHLRGVSQLTIRDRYEKFLSFFKIYLFFKKRTYTFIFDEKILQVQSVFVVDEDINWESLVIVRYLFEKHGHLFSTVLLNFYLINNKPSVLWGLIDTGYGEKDVSKAIKSGRSFFIEKKLLMTSLECASSIKNSHLPIVPIHSFKNKKRCIYRFGDAVKPSDLLRISNISFSTTMENIFKKLQEKFLCDIRKSDRKNNKN